MLNVLFVSRLRKVMCLFILGILLTGGFMLSVKASSVTLGAQCSVGHPWWWFWTSDWEARAQVNVTHGQTGGNLYPHWHTGNYWTEASMNGSDVDINSGGIYFASPNNTGVTYYYMHYSASKSGQPTGSEYATGDILVYSHGSDKDAYCWK